jgi:hypothetical protein
MQKAIFVSKTARGMNLVITAFKKKRVLGWWRQKGGRVMDESLYSISYSVPSVLYR